MHQKLVNRLGTLDGIERFGGMMMNYKVGDEVLVKVKIAGCTSSERCMIKVDRTELFVNEEAIIPIPDMTAEEAWEIAKKLKQMNEDELLEVFRTNVEHLVLKDFSPQQAKARIEAWEAEKEIKVGDVVRVTLGKLDEGETDTALITWVHENNWYDLIMKNGLGWTYVNGERIKKTGRHIDIDGILKQIGGNE